MNSKLMTMVEITMMEMSISTLQKKSQYLENQINNVKLEPKGKLGKEEEEEKLLKIGYHSNHNHSINSLSKKIRKA
jgi:hypothetical protein